MVRINIKNELEYLSLIAVLSYFLLHSIVLVLLGILFSLYLLNKNFIDDHIKFIKKKKEDIDEIKEVNSKQLEFKKAEPRLTLVEKIEELGFIPSIDTDADSDAA